MSNPNHITISGAPEGYDAKLLLDEVRKSGPVCHIARDDKRLAAMQAALAFFAPDMPVLGRVGSRDAKGICVADNAQRCDAKVAAAQLVTRSGFQGRSRKTYG